MRKQDILDADQEDAERDQRNLERLTDIFAQSSTGATFELALQVSKLRSTLIHLFENNEKNS